MVAKKIWLTWLSSDQGADGAKDVAGNLTSYGMDVTGAPWVDDLKKMVWCELGTSLMDPKSADVWMVMGSREQFQARSLRYGLSLVMAMIRDGRDRNFPVFALGLDHLPVAETMPTLLRSFQFLSGKESSWAAKMAASLVKKPKHDPSEFRFNAIGHSFIGQWFEVGPTSGEWDGAMFGVNDGAKITYHLVGSKGQLPEKSTLEFPTEGIKAEVRNTEFFACSAKNRIDPNSSYFVRVEGYPDSVLFGGHPGTDRAEVNVLELA